MSQKIETTILNYKYLDVYITDIYEDIKNIVDTHTSLYTSINRKEHYYQYGVYIDDIYFQKNVMLKEIQHIENLRGMSIRKLYADLFRLYQRVIKKYLELLKDNDNAGSLKKYYTELNIKIFNELDIITIYKYRDIENIAQHLIIHIGYIENMKIDMMKNMEIMKEKMNFGYNVGSFILAYSGEVMKLEMDIRILREMYDMILNINERMLIKMLKRSKLLANEVSDNKKEYEEKMKNVTIKISGENTPVSISSPSSSPSLSPSKVVMPNITETISISGTDSEEISIDGRMVKDEDNMTETKLVLDEMREQIEHNGNHLRGDGDFNS